MVVRKFIPPELPFSRYKVGQSIFRGPQGRAMLTPIMKMKTYNDF